MGGGENEITISAILNTAGFQKGSKQLERAIRGLSMSAKHLAGTLIGVGSAYGILSKAVGAFMAQNKQLSANMQSVWTAFGNLLGPIITQVINWITTAVAYFIEFLRLLGITTKTAKEASKAAGGAGGALQKTLAGFDELNKLSKGGGGGANGSLPNTDPVKWMEDLANALKNKMWDEAADIIIAKMNDIIAGFKKKAAELGDLLADWIAGFTHILARVIKEVNWAGIGEGIAEFLNNAFREVDGKELGTILVGKIIIAMQVVAGFLETLDWKQLAIKVSDIIIGVFESLGESIAKIDWKKIGTGIRTFFENIDWEGIKESIYGFLKDAWEGALDLLWGLIAGDSAEEPPIVASLRKLGEAVGEVVRSIEEKMPDLREFIGWLKDSEIPRIIDEITAVLEDLAAIINGDFKWQDSALSKGMGDILLVLGGLAALNWGGISSGFSGVSGGITGIGTSAMNAIGGVASFVDKFTEVIDLTAGGAGGFIESLTAVFPAITTAAELAAGACVIALAAYGDVLEKQENAHMIQSVYNDDIAEMANQYDLLQAQILDVNNSYDAQKVAIEMQSTALDDLAKALNMSTDELMSQYNAMDGSKSMAELVAKLLSEMAESEKEVTEGASAANESVKGMVEGFDESGAAAQTAADSFDEATKQLTGNYEDLAEKADENMAAVRDTTEEKSQEAADLATTATSELSEQSAEDYETLRDRISAAMSDIVSAVSDGWSQVVSDTESALSNMASTCDSYLSSISSSAYAWGQDLIYGFVNGIYSTGGYLQGAMISVANLVASYIGFSEPDKGPLSNFHTFAPDMMDLFANGIKQNEGEVVGAVSELAGGISDAMDSGDYSIDIDASMSNFADKIVDGFSDLIDRMQAIADNVVFTMPAMAGGGVVPYGVGGGGFGVPGVGGGTDVSTSIETLNGLMVEFMDEIRNMKWVAKFGKVEAVVEEITRVQKQNERARG